MDMYTVKRRPRWSGGQRGGAGACGPAQQRRPREWMVRAFISLRHAVCQPVIYDRHRRLCRSSLAAACRGLRARLPFLSSDYLGEPSRLLRLLARTERRPVNGVHIRRDSVRISDTGHASGRRSTYTQTHAAELSTGACRLTDRCVVKRYSFLHACSIDILYTRL